MDMQTFAVFGKEIRNITDRVTNLETLKPAMEYGIKHTISTDTVERIGNSIGKVANANGGLNDFNYIMPWAAMRRCNLSDSKQIMAYYGETNYKEDGTNGQVMVEVPAFYYKRYMPDSDTIITYISMTKLFGYKLHPWFYDKNGIERAKAYFSAFEGSVLDVSTAVAEVNTLTVTAPCATSGNITINLDKYNSFAIPLLNTDNTTDLVAAKIRAAAYTGWTTGGTGSAVTFTCNNTGLRTTAIFSGGSTGVTATASKTISGAGGYTKMDAAGVDFTTSTGDKLSSVSGVKPVSGMYNSLTLPNARKLANNRGSGWEQQIFNAVSAIQMLIIVEYGSLKSQSVIGQGVVNLADDGATNMASVTGATSSLGNGSGKAAGADGLVSISYRGIENFWGNTWKWTDGINISNGVSYISNINGNFISDVFTGQYVNTGFSNANANGYVSKVGISSALDYGYIPIEVAGSSTTKYADYFYQTGSGSFVARLGGSWTYGTVAGAFYWYLNDGSGYVYRNIGARLCA